MVLLSLLGFMPFLCSAQNAQKHNYLIHVPASDNNGNMRTIYLDYLESPNTYPTRDFSIELIPLNQTQPELWGDWAKNTDQVVINSRFKDVENLYYTSEFFSSEKAGGTPAIKIVKGMNNLPNGANLSSEMSMAKMFLGCANLTTVEGFSNDGSRGPFQNVQSMASLFEGCTSLSKINNNNVIGGLNVYNLQSLSHTFADCKSLKTLDLHDWQFKSGNNLPKLEDMTETFGRDSLLTTLILAGWDVSRVTSLESTFNNCVALETLNLGYWETSSSLTSLARTFLNCHELTSLSNIAAWNVSGVTDMQSTFNGCWNLESLDVSNWETPALKNMIYTFYGCGKLTSLDLSEWSLNNVTSMLSTFHGCHDLTEIKGIGSKNVSNVQSLASTFYNCEKLPSLDLSSWNTGKVESMNHTFFHCKGLTSLNVSGWNTSNVTSMQSAFNGCDSLTNLHLVPSDEGIWDLQKVKSLKYTFAGCTKLKGLVGPCLWNLSNTETMLGAFKDCFKLKTISGDGNILNPSNAIINWTTTNKLQEIDSLFSNCHALERLTFGDNFVTSGVKSVKGMFNGCSSLKSVSFGKGFSLKSLSSTNGYYNYSGMFAGCPKLRYIDFRSSDASAVQHINRDAETNMFYDVPRTTVIYLPKNKSLGDNELKKENVVYNENGTWKCKEYYSEDKVDIEFPETFRTNKATYTRNMAGEKHGTVILPFKFKSNNDILAYELKCETAKGEVYFQAVDEVPAHTPFAFLNRSNNDAVTFVMQDTSENFGIEVKATQDTEEKGPYTDSYGKNGGNILFEGWTSKGYYVKQTENNIANTYFVYDDKLYKAGRALTLNPHRVTFQGTLSNGGGAAKLIFVGKDDNPTAIYSPELQYDNAGDATVYDISGHQLNGLRRGVNIVHKADGTVKKVIIK